VSGQYENGWGAKKGIELYWVILKLKRVVTLSTMTFYRDKVKNRYVNT
jgi:hypothetical protein